jgi:hypothetical protein
MSEESKECLRATHDAENCSGEITRRFTDEGTPIDECKYHTDKSYQRREELKERYPDSPIAPDWFDPTVAGERWDDDY